MACRLPHSAATNFRPLPFAYDEQAAPRGYESLRRPDAIASTPRACAPQRKEARRISVVVE